MSQHDHAGPVGAYGFRLDPDLFGRRYLHPAAPGWPDLAVRLGGTRPSAADGWREVFAGDGWEVRVQRGGGTVWWSGRGSPGLDARVHPLLSVVACAATLERGGDCMHAGAVLTPDGVVLVLGSPGGGKTTTMAWLAVEAGLDVFTDDQLNVRDGVAHAGPACLDLRPDAARRLGVQGLTTRVRADGRLRLELKPPARLCAPVVRVAVLEWGSRLRISTVPPRQRLGVLCTHRTAQVAAGDLRVPLGLAAVPMLRLRRPRGFDCMRVLARALVDG